MCEDALFHLDADDLSAGTVRLLILLDGIVVSCLASTPSAE